MNDKEKLPITKDETLFSLVHLSHQIQKALVESMGEMTPEIERAIRILHERLPDKADGYKFFIDDLRAQAVLFNERASLFARIAKSFTSYSETLKYSIKMACMELGVNEIEGREFRWKLVNNAPSLVVDDESLIPSEYKEEVVSVNIKSDMIKEALKNGKTVPGAHLETGSHVRPYPNMKVK